MVIGILYSEAGSGKTYNALHFEEPIILFDMENRDQKKIDRYFSEKLIKNLELKKYDKDFYEDKIGSFKAFITEREKLTSSNKEDFPVTVIIDGIGELRDYAKALWCKENNRKNETNPGDSKAINDKVRDELFPLINWARIYGINLIFTAQMRDNYSVVTDDEGKKKQAKDGRIPSYKEFAAYNVDFLIELWQPKGKDGKIIPGCYKATCTKSELGSWEEEITGKNLYDIFVSKGMM